MAWIFLILAGLLEVGFTTAMQFAKTTKGWWPYVLFAVCISTSFGLLLLASREIPVGTAYAVWTGIGAAGTAVLGIAVFGEPATAARILFLSLLIVSVIGLKAFSPH